MQQDHDTERFVRSSRIMIQNDLWEAARLWIQNDL